jgi:iron complex outermembrane receptor protein
VLVRNVLVRVFVASLAVAIATAAIAAPAQPEQEELKRLSIEELMRIDVTTAGRRAEPIGTTAAAISVITGEDIRRSGVTTIADAIQLADGVHVARFNNGTWAIASRGFVTNSTNKLLVMVDGRTVYSPLFSGTFWNMVDYVLADIDRIEVNRGPGAALWGANAVNGIINIITRHSADTAGTLVTAASGHEDPLVAEFRYGGATGGVTWRGYGKTAVRAAQQLAGGDSAEDGRRRGQVGFRADGGSLDGMRWLLKGDLFHSRDSFADRADGEFTDANLQARWSAPVGTASRVDVQSYYRREYRSVPQQLTHAIDTFDVDAQHAVTLPRHAIVWGAGVRVNRDTTEGSQALAFVPEQRTYRLASVFAQDEIALLPARLFATVGAKYEHNAFSGGEFQPNVRLRYLMTRDQIIWGAVSRAARRPTRLDDDLRVFGPTGALLLRGTGDFVAESLVATEVGYRIQPLAILSVDATVFQHRFTDLRSQDLPPAGPPIVIGNTLEGESHGLELAVKVQAHERVRTHIGYTWLDTDVMPAPGSRDISGGVSEANDPHHLFSFRTAVDLPRNVEFDAMLRSIGELPNPRVPAYTELNLRVGWRATPQLEIWGAGQDLLHARHPEFGPDTPARVQFERAVRVGITFRTRR